MMKQGSLLETLVILTTVCPYCGITNIEKLTSVPEEVHIQCSNCEDYYIIYG